LLRELLELDELQPDTAVWIFCPYKFVAFLQAVSPQILSGE
jgi:hypothetical protein